MPRKMALRILYAVMNGIPRKHTVRYAAVPSAASAGVDMTATMGHTSATSKTVSTTATPANRVTVLPLARVACARLPPPTACATCTVVPMASPTSTTVSICIT